MKSEGREVIKQTSDLVTVIPRDLADIRNGELSSCHLRMLYADVGEHNANLRITYADVSLATATV